MKVIALSSVFTFNCLSFFKYTSNINVKKKFQKVQNTGQKFILQKLTFEKRFWNSLTFIKILF